MDKETLSNYGWIVICVMVLAVMLAFASPFGNFVANAIKSTTQGLFDVNQNALDSAGIEIMEQEFEEMLNGPSATDSPVKFGQPYQITMDGMLMEYVFYADGSATMWMGDAIGGYMPAGSFTYTTTEVIMGEDPLSISADGTTLYDPEDETLVMTLKSVTTSKLKSGTYTLDPNGFLGLGVTIDIEIGADGSVTLYYNGMESGTILASKITWHDNYFVISEEGQEDLVCAIYPDSSKITYGDYVCVARKPLGPGLYSAANQQLASWDELVNTYGMDVSKNYTNSNYQTDVNSPYYVLTNTEELSTGVRLIVDNNVTTIGDYAFRSCEKLTSIKLPDSLRSIGQYAFYGCSRLKNINIPEGITIINNHTFYQCTDLTSIEFPNSLTSIGRYAIYNCNSLTNITIPNGVKSIDYSAFAFCINLTSFTISESVTSIGDYNFYACGKLQNIVVDANNPNYCSMDDVLYTKDMTTLVAYPAAKNGTTYEVPNSVTSISPAAFQGCTLLTNVKLSDNINTISEDAFYRCTALTNITIPEGVTSVDSSAFMDCTSLTSINLPDSVTVFGQQLFQGCSSLGTINFAGTTTQWNKISKGWNWDGKTYGDSIPATEVICSDGTVSLS